MNYSYVAKAVVINKEGKFLVLRRSATDPHAPGRADLPGGGVETGESYVASAARELAEEAGLTVRPELLQLGYTMSRLSSRGDAVIVRFLFFAQVDDDVVTLSHEHDAYEWCEASAFQAALATTAWSEAIDFLMDHHIITAA